MIKVLCMSCASHLYWTDQERLDWPLYGEMFTPAQPNHILRPGQLSLDIFCPICHQFPFWHDGNTPGSRGVGKYLNIQGPDGKPAVRSIKQILMDDSREPLLLGDERASQAVSEPPVSQSPIISPKEIPAVFPCSECGAKRNFHKRGCSKQIARPVPRRGGAESQNIGQDNDPFLDNLIKQVQRKEPEAAPNAPPTQAEIAELMAERERRSDPTPAKLRPGEGYAPQPKGVR